MSTRLPDPPNWFMLVEGGEVEQLPELPPHVLAPEKGSGNLSENQTAECNVDFFCGIVFVY